MIRPAATRIDSDLALRASQKVGLLPSDVKSHWSSGEVYVNLITAYTLSDKYVDSFQNVAYQRQNCLLSSIVLPTLLGRLGTLNVARHTIGILHVDVER